MTYKSNDTVDRSTAPPLDGADSLLICALMHSTASEVAAIARLVHADDLDEPAATVFCTIVNLAARVMNPIPALVADELRRRGQFDRRHATWLMLASTAKADPLAARFLAATVVSTRLRRLAESYGQAHVAAAASGPESALAELAERAAKHVRTTQDRLDGLRGK